MSSMLQALYKSRGTADKMRSLRIQRAIKLCYWIKVRQEATVPQSSLKCWRSWAPIEVKLLKIGVVLIKPTTSYFLFLVTFGHNRICGLAVCLLFFRELPALSKTKKKQNPKAVSARDVVLPCQFCWLPPPPPPPIGTRSHPLILIPLPGFARCSGRGAKLAHATASHDFYLWFFLLQTPACGLAQCLKKIPFPLRCAHPLPFWTCQSQ